MREVILHIGMHKTGTSSIQDSLYNVEFNGFKTLRFAEKNHSIPMYTIFSKKRLQYAVWKARGYNDNQIIEKKAQYEEILEEELRDESVDCFLLSGEDMSSLSESEQISLCEFFEKRNFKVRVICVVRDPVSFATSANQQHAKSGAKGLRKLNPSYKRRLSGYIKGCGRENVSVLKYEDLREGGLIKSFSEIIGIPLEEKPRANESLTSEGLALLYVFNNIQTSTVGSELKFQARRAIIDAIRFFFSISNGFKKLTLKEYNIIGEAANEDLAWLEKNFGVSYQRIVKAEQQKLVYDKYPSEEYLSEFFQTYALNYETSLSLSYNLEILYERFLWFKKIDIQIKSLISKADFQDALKLSKKAFELGDAGHSSYRQASNISHRLNAIDDAIAFAKQAVNAKDNNNITRANHKKHLANMLRIAGQIDDASSTVDEYE